MEVKGRARIRMGYEIRVMSLRSIYIFHKKIIF